MSGQTERTTELRLGGFDIIRILAAFGVVVLHASAPYLAHPMPGLAWSISDEPSYMADFFGWSVELFIMPLFLLIAGFFTPAVAAKLSTWDFLKHRFQRLIIPLSVGMVLILPADLYIWLTGWVIEEKIPLRKMQSLKFEAGVDNDLWGLSHLWFLQYLFLYTVVYAVSRKIRIEKSPFAQALSPWNALLGMAVLAWGILWLVPKVVFGFQHDFFPVPSKWLYSGIYFAAGVIIANSKNVQQFLKDRWPTLLTVGCFATIAGVVFGCRMLAEETNVISRSLATLFTVISAWTISCGAIGWASTAKWSSSYTLRYFAAASFWVYLVHHPIVGLCHIHLKVVATSWPSELKLVIATIVALAFSLLSFEVLVRRWPLSTLLATPREFVKTPNTQLHRAHKTFTVVLPAELAMK